MPADDAMGHGIQAALMAALVVGCYRHGRREGTGLARIHADLDRAMAEHFPGLAFATGTLARIDLETGEMMEVTPDYAAHEYRDKITAHLDDLKSRAKGAGLDYCLIDTSRPLDAALREYLAVRKGKM